MSDKKENKPSALGSVLANIKSGSMKLQDNTDTKVDDKSSSTKEEIPAKNHESSLLEQAESGAAIEKVDDAPQKKMSPVSIAIIVIIVAGGIYMNFFEPNKKSIDPVSTSISTPEQYVDANSAEAELSELDPIEVAEKLEAEQKADELELPIEGVIDETTLAMQVEQNVPPLEVEADTNLPMETEIITETKTDTVTETTETITEVPQLSADVSVGNDFSDLSTDDIPVTELDLSVSDDIAIENQLEQFTEISESSDPLAEEVVENAAPAPIQDNYDDSLGLDDLDPVEASGGSSGMDNETGKQILDALNLLTQQHVEMKAEMSSLKDGLKDSNEKSGFVSAPALCVLSIAKAARNCDTCVPHAFVAFDGKSTEVGKGDDVMGYKVDIAGDQLFLVDEQKSMKFSYWVNKECVREELTSF